MKNPGKIANKIKRSAIFSKYKEQKKKLKKKLREIKEKEVEKLGEAAPPKQIPKTIENTRKDDETFVLNNNNIEEILGDEKDDEFSRFFNGSSCPKIMISTKPNCTRKLYEFISDLMNLIPNSFYYKREEKKVYDLLDECKQKDFTHLIILNEKNKKCNSMLLTCLPYGPSAYFKISNILPSYKISNHGHATTHIPEIILNNFTTRLGRRIGRFLGSLYPHNYTEHNPEDLKGRQVVTFHNQRDFIFLRYHRYIYKEEENKVNHEKKVRAKLQELGPRFTIKLKYLQDGIFNNQFGEYEWIAKRTSEDGTKKKFYL